MPNLCVKFNILVSLSAMAASIAAFQFILPFMSFTANSRTANS